MFKLKFVHYIFLILYLMADNDQVVSKSDFLILKENTYCAGNGVNGSVSGPNLTLLKVKVNV